MVDVYRMSDDLETLISLRAGRPDVPLVEEEPPPPPPPPPPPEPEGKLALLMTVADYEMMRQRRLSGPYRVRGDVRQNSPGIWNDILVPEANKVYSNPSAHVYNGFTGYWQPVVGNHQTLEVGEYMALDGAQLHAIVDGSVTFRTHVKNILVSQANQANFDFRDEQKFHLGVRYAEEWGTTADTFGDYDRGIRSQFVGNFAFPLGTCLRIWCYAFSNLEAFATYWDEPSLFTTAEKNNLLDWLYHVARALMSWSDRNSNVMWGWNRNRFNMVFQRQIGSSYETTWWNRNGAGGTPSDRNYARQYNNQYSEMMAAAWLTAQLCEDHGYTPPSGKLSLALLKQRAFQRFKEYMACSVYPDGTYPDTHRDLGGSEVGFAYTSACVYHHAQMANAELLTGGTQLWDFTTTAGYDSFTQGTPSGFAGKGLPWYYRLLCNYMIDAYDRYSHSNGASSAGDAQYRLDGRRPRDGSQVYYVAPFIALGLDHYTGSTLHRQVLDRTYPGSLPYPASPGWPNWRNPGALMGSLFQFDRNP
jgi:hypothetical protein